jgi:hypothetical protein
MVSAANGLYWRLHSIQYRRHRHSRLFDNGFLSEDHGFLIPCASRTPILDGKFLPKCAVYTRANKVLFFNFNIKTNVNKLQYFICVIIPMREISKVM